MEKFRFNKIFTSIDEYGYINILFFNDIELTAIEFDGLNFYSKKGITKISVEYKELNYRNKTKEDMFLIDGLKQNDDINFAKVSNGDIFQIYFMVNDEQANQQLSIFSEESKKINTPLGVSLYDTVLKRFNEADNVKILNEESI